MFIKLRSAKMSAIKTLILFLLTTSSAEVLYSQIDNNIAQGHSQPNENKQKKLHGIVFGKIIDAITGEIISGIQYSVDGNITLTGQSDNDGKYKLVLLPGTYTLTFKSATYETNIVENILVVAGRDTILNVVLEPVNVELKGAVVKGKLKKETTSALMIQQKNAPAVSDGISMENIRKTPDRTTADVMKRVSGANVQDGRFVVVRGLNDRYNSAYINGLPLPSTEADRKAFSFDLIPAAMIDNVVVYKTATPDKTAEFSGGLIEISTRDIPEKKFMQIQFGSSYNTISTFKRTYQNKGSSTDFLGFDNGSRSIPSGIPDSKVYTKSSIQQQIDYSKKFNNNWSVNNNKLIFPGGSFSLVFGKPFKIYKKQAGVFLGMIYNNQTRKVMVERNDYDKNGYVFNFNDTGFKNNVNLSLIWNNTIEISRNFKLGFKNMLSVNSESQTIVRSGTDYVAENYRTDYGYYYSQNILTSSQLYGEHQLIHNKSKLIWNLGYNFIDRKIPDYRRLRYMMPTANSQPDPDNPIDYWQAYVNPTASPNDGGRFYSRLRENMMSARVDYSNKFKRFKLELKSGAGSYFRFRDFSARILGYISNPAFNYSLLKLPVSDIFSDNTIYKNGFRLSENTNPSDQYKAQSRLLYYYVMADQRLGTKLRVIYGVRVEQYQQELESNEYTGREIKINNTKTDLLPSLNITYLHNKKTNFRVAYFQSLARPEFRELAPFSFFDFNQFLSVQGNSKLLRTKIHNADFRYEIYPRSGEVFSAGLFYKYFINPVEVVLDPAIGGGTRTQNYKNIDKALCYGFETELRKKLPEILGIMWTKYMLFNLNFSYLITRVDMRNVPGSGRIYRPMQGQSPFIINAGITYQNKGWVFATHYNYSGDRIIAVGTANYPEYYEKGRHIIDMQLGKSFKKEKAEIKLNVSDFLAQRLIQYQPLPVNINEGETIDTKYENARVINAYKMGRTISIQFSYKF